jgi:hypothetical protein
MRLVGISFVEEALPLWAVVLEAVFGTLETERKVVLGTFVLGKAKVVLQEVQLVFELVRGSVAWVDRSNSHYSFWAGAEEDQ